jgi:hypothetical protein
MLLAYFGMLEISEAKALRLSAQMCAERQISRTPHFLQLRHSM